MVDLRCRDAGSTLEERLELLVQVCHGVQHAHQKGIIHRDIHPANIIADPSRGKAMLIDLGLAGTAGGEVLDFVDRWIERRGTDPAAWPAPPEMGC